MATCGPVSLLLLLICLTWFSGFDKVVGFPASVGTRREEGGGPLRYPEDGNSTQEPDLHKIKSDRVAALFDGYIQNEIRQGVKLQKSSQEAKHLAKLLEERAQEVQHRVHELIGHGSPPHAAKDEHLAMREREHKHPSVEDFADSHGNHISLHSEMKGVHDHQSGRKAGDDDESLGNEQGMKHHRYGPLFRGYKEEFEPNLSDPVDLEQYDNDDDGLGSHDERISMPLHHPRDRDTLVASRIAAIQHELNNRYGGDSIENHDPHHRMQGYPRHSSNNDHRLVSEHVAWYRRPDLLLDSEFAEK